MMILLGMLAFITAAAVLAVGSRWYGIYRDSRSTRSRHALHHERERHWFAKNLFFYRRARRRLTYRFEPPHDR